jgi:hypothetical protein
MDLLEYLVINNVHFVCTESNENLLFPFLVLARLTTVRTVCFHE